MNRVAFVALVTMTVVLIATLIVIDYRGQENWEKGCRANGGHVESTTHTNTVVTFTNGKPGTGVTSDTDYFCVTSDGRLLGVR